MNIKLKRTVRTPYSEEISIFDGDNRDENDEAVNIGKLELHFLDDQIVGTLLIWQEYATGFNRANPPGSDLTMDALVDQILMEAGEPLGLPSDYGVEVYFPSVTNHQFVSNYAAEEGEEETVGEDEYTGGEQAPRGQAAPRTRDEFAERLRSRP